MASFYSRLFRHVRFDRTHSEGFALEALAEAIRRDPEPFLRALAARGWFAGDASVQVDMAAARARDGAVELEVGLTVDGEARTLRLVVDGAPDDGRAPGERVALMRRAWEREGRAMLWNDLRAQVRPDAHIYWHELRAFLEEQQLADDADEPLRASSTAALREAQAVLRATARIAVAFAVQARGLGPRALTFPTSEGDVCQALAHQFARSGRLCVYGHGSPWVALGIEVPTQRPGALSLRLWVETAPGDEQGGRELFAAAERAGLPAEAWAREQGDCWALVARVPIADELDQVEAVAWFVRRAQELVAAGVLQRPSDHEGTPLPPVSGELI